MPNDDTTTEQAIIAAGAAAGPRITPAHLDACIASEQHYRFPGTTLTVCCLTLCNGFTVTGESACADPSNFNEAIGMEIARKNAREKIWALEGYLLKQRLHDYGPHTELTDPNL